MEFDIVFHGKTLADTWENIFRIGHAGHQYSDFRCSKNDRYPAMWIDADSNAFVFDISDKQNCFRQYGTHEINPHTLYKVTIDYNSSWIYIQINNQIVTNQARANHTDLTQLGTDLHIYISTVTSNPANVTLSNIVIRSYDDTSLYHLTTTTQPTIAPSNAPTVSPTFTPTISKSPTKRPTTFLPTIYVPHTTYDDDDVRLFSTTDDALPSTSHIMAFNGLFTSPYINMTQVDLAPQSVVKHGGLSFEVIFYILTGCAMGGILFCVCTCCCFGCIINKKIKNLSSHENEPNDEEEQEDMIDKKSVEGALHVHESKLRVHTVSQDISHSVNKTDESIMIVSNEPETITRSPTINRLSSPSSAMSHPTFHPPSTSSASRSPTSPPGRAQLYNKSSLSTSMSPSSTNVKLNFDDLDSSKSMSNRPKFSQKFHKRLAKLKENDEAHNKMRMTSSVPDMDSAEWNIKIERSGSPTREDTVIKIETQKTVPSGEDEDNSQCRIISASSRQQNMVSSISPLHLSSAQFDSNQASYFDSLYSKNTSSKLTPSPQPMRMYSNPSTNTGNGTHYSLFVHKPRSPLILDMNVANIGEENEEEADTETETQTQTPRTLRPHSHMMQSQQQSKASSKHYQIQIDYANSERSANTTHKLQTPITMHGSYDNKSIGDIEMDMNSIHTGKISPRPESPSNKLEEDEELKQEILYGSEHDAGTKRGGSYHSTIRKSTKDSLDIDIEEAISHIEQEEDVNQGGIRGSSNNTNQTNRAKEYLQLPCNDSNISRLSNTSSNSSASSSATSCSSSCSSSSSSNSDSTTCSSSSTSTDSTSSRCTADGRGHHTLDTLKNLEEITSQLSGSSAYYSNATHSYVD